MATLPSEALPTSLMNIVVDARNSDGAHAYYSNGWEIKYTDVHSKVNLPGHLKDKCSYTVVFKHDGTPTTTKHELIFGVENAEDKSRVAIQSQKFYTALVTEHQQAQKKHADISKSNIALDGFHVLEYKNQGGALQVYLDGTACLTPNTVRDNVESYTVFKCYPKNASPLSIWEGHYIFDNYKTITPKFHFLHDYMLLGVGSYIQIHANWTATITVWPDGGHDKIEVPNKVGEQIFTVRVYNNGFAITTSSPVNGKEEALHRTHPWPLSTLTDIGQDVNPLYSVTVFFTEIISP